MRRSLEPDAQKSSTQVPRIVQGWLGVFFILVCHQAFAGKAVVSVRLDPSTIDRGEAFDVYVTENSSGSGSDDTYACTKITLDGDSLENDHANVTLGASNIEYGPYSVTSQADISDGAYSVTVAIYSKDACNGGSATGSASLTVASVNASPLADDDAVAVDEDSSIAINVLDGDIDSDGSIDPTTLVIGTNPTNGTVSVNATTGVVTYSGDANFSGSDEFTYTVNDDSGSTSNLATVAIIVNSVNDAPTFIGDGSGSVLKGGGYTITTADLFYLDPDSEDGDADVTFTASALILVSFLLLPWFLFWPSLLFGLLLLFRLSRAIQGISLRG